MGTIADHSTLALTLWRTVFVLANQPRQSS